MAIGNWTDPGDGGFCESQHAAACGYLNVVLPLLLLLLLLPLPLLVVLVLLLLVVVLLLLLLLLVLLLLLLLLLVVLASIKPPAVNIMCACAFVHSYGR